MPNDDNKIILEFPATNVEIELGETITFDNISGFLDSERVTYNGESLADEITHLENDKADTTYVNEELDKKADKTDTYTKTQVDNALNNKMDKANPTGTGSLSINRKSNSVVGNNSMALGYNVVASASNSFAEGDNTVSSAQAAHAEGYATEASARFAHAEGRGTVANSENAHAEGYNSTASGGNSHAEGNGTTASGGNSHAEGNGTTASGSVAHAEGRGTVANHRSQHVFGEHNIPDDSTATSTNKGNYIEIVGNGTSESNRSNARTLDWQGNETLAGNLTYNGNKSLTSEISRLDGRIDTKANTSDVYTKSQTDNLLNGKADVSDLPDMTQYYDKSEVDTALGNKADQSDLSSLANVVSGLSDDVEALDQNKADKSDTYTKEQVDDIVYNILPDDTASGSVANFETSLEMPIKSLEVDVNAVQSAGTPTPETPLPISGRSEINLYQLGGNFFNKNTVTSGLLINASGNEVSYADWNTSDFIPVVEGASYYLYGLTAHPNTNQDNFELFNASKVKVGYANVKTNEQPYVIPSGVAYIKCCVKNQDIDTAQLGVSVNASFVTYNPTLEKYVIDLGGTYYGGKFTQDKDGHRRFVVTSKFATFTGANNESWNDYPAGNGFFINLINDHITESYGDGKCNILPTSKTFSNLGIVFGINSSYIFLMQVKSSWNISTVNELRDFLSVNNLQVVYTLAEPIIIDLPDGEPIANLVGTNNIFADSGDTSVVFKDSVNGYVEKKIANVQALILNG